MRNHTIPGTIFKKGSTDVIYHGSVQPPKKHTVASEAIMIIAIYSPRKKSANLKLLYSVKYPATSSLSASGISKGVLFVSANAAIVNTRKAAIWGITYIPKTH